MVTNEVSTLQIENVQCPTLTLMMDMYENLCQKIEDVTGNPSSFQFEGDFAVFLNTEKRNHPSIVKVILDGLSDGLPHLIYVSREKRPKYEHNYKGGAMNVLTRVSGLMTNAPFMLNVDCDMFVNNPKIIQHAICILVDSKNGKDVAFVQCFQQFYDGIKDDPFGNQWVAAFEYIIRGMAGLQGPHYCGTNTIHRRYAIYGFYPNERQHGKKGKLADKILIQQFGSSNEFIKSATKVMEGSDHSTNEISSSNFIEEAIQVSNCGYEYGTCWGKQKRLEIGAYYAGSNRVYGLRSRRITDYNDPTKEMGFRAGLSYCWLTNWGLRSVFEVSYAALVAYCIIANTSIFPKFDKTTYKINGML
ncbi:hypothetical protein TSUD_106260 [Trifolium subterraneum]|uniref:Glycosyltransferase 2-like domain-containing protein n=1 Tax=Trifolium subterraneum TaxID=3900 RepID=A0A2Z6LMS8_TRISU|nr:hypothetical protein TSUD_106260 [Trifolium subterraneum]